MFIDRIKLLVGSWHDRQRSSREVKRLARAHVAELQVKTAELTGMCATRLALAEPCHGDQQPDCPMLRDLEAVGGRQCMWVESRGKS